MPNTINNLIPDFFRALDVVSRELTGFVNSVTLDSGVERAAVGQTVRSPVTAQGTAEDVAPGTTPPDTGDQTIGNEQMTIEKSRCVPFRWDGEQSRGLNNGGPGRRVIQVDQIAQAIRVLVNEMESWTAQKVHLRSSRAFGTAGTPPFGGGGTPSITDLVHVLQILKDNGCPQSDLYNVFNTDAGVNLLSVPNLFKVNEAGTDTFVRQGEFANLFGTSLKESAGVYSHTKGTGTGYFVNNASGYNIGDTVIAVDTGSGTVLAGDVVTFAGDNNKYIVKTALSGGNIELNGPGLRQTLADGVAMTVGANYQANMIFHRSAAVLATRPPAIPEEGDMADDAQLVTDPRSGLTFEIRMYKQYRRVRYEVCIAYGAFGIKPEHTATLLG